MRKYTFFLLAIVLTMTFSGQTHKHKSKHHDKITTHSVSPVDTVKSSTAQIVVGGPTLKEMQDARITKIFIGIGSIILLIILLAIISDRRKKSKRIKAEQQRIATEKEEKEQLAEAENRRKSQLLNELEQSFDRKEILEENYTLLKSNFNSYNSSHLASILTEAKSKKEKLDYLHSKYNVGEVNKILSHEYWIGMTEEQLIDAKGKPTQIDLEQLKTKTKKIYIYGNKSSGDVFNFVDGVLERFKDR